MVTVTFLEFETGKIVQALNQLRFSITNYSSYYFVTKPLYYCNNLAVTTVW